AAPAVKSHLTHGKGGGPVRHPRIASHDSNLCRRPPSMPDTRLIIVDPGHFHAALVQKEMYPSLSAEAHVYAPLGPDLIDYLGRIARFNARPDQPTRWGLAVHAAADFQASLAQEPPGGVAVIAGRNRPKIGRIA